MSNRSILACARRCECKRTVNPFLKGQSSVSETVHGFLYCINMVIRACTEIAHPRGLPQSSTAVLLFYFPGIQAWFANGKLPVFPISQSLSNARFARSPLMMHSGNQIRTCSGTPLTASVQRPDCTKETGMSYRTAAGKKKPWFLPDHPVHS